MDVFADRPTTVHIGLTAIGLLLAACGGIGSHEPGATGGAGGFAGAAGSGGAGAGGISGAGGDSRAAGSGGFAGSGGGIAGAGGGIEGGVPRCVSGQTVGCVCTTGQMGAQVCHDDGTYGSCTCAPSDGGTWEQQQLARLRRGIVGTWQGKQTSEWSTCPSTIVFEASGHYTAHSENDSCVVFYYNDNADAPYKVYSLDDVNTVGEGSGELTVWQSGSNRGILLHVFLSDDQKQLKFQWYNGSYGPFVFSLERVAF
jgi:hypothetical protein